MRKHPTCEECLKDGRIIPAKVVDHITPIKQGGNKYDSDNLQSLCISCHNRKSVEEGSRFGKGKNNDG
ncbi:MAG: HNH endonuclease [Desulfobacteraceae bacterium]|nr:HNH endonuclease [Desulfobacteraceae bacterium]